MATRRPRAGGSCTMPGWRSSSSRTRWTARRGGRLSWPVPRREHEVAIFLTEQSRVLIQGITGGEGRKHGARMLAAGTTVVGGTNPKKAGQTVELNGTDVPVIRVPPAGAEAAVIEAIDAGIPLAIVITEGIPVHDTAEFWAYASE